jgi:septal ring-binding cell division protein DamX
LHNAVAAAVLLGNAATTLLTRAAAAPSAPAPAAGAGPSERYFIQVSARRADLEARLAFHTLQLRFPAVLKDRQVVIRRTDTTVGPWYRVLAGPYESAAEATSACNALKAAGGQCIVVAEPGS